jgi:ATP synthase F1 gamma subunit
MPTLKEVQLKIQGVKKTKQITKAMNMVATSRLRGAQGAMDGFRPYAEKFSEVLGSLAEKAGDEASPLLIPKEEVKKIHVVLCTSDRGLCGGFNINLTDAAKIISKITQSTVPAIPLPVSARRGGTGAAKTNTRSPMHTSVSWAASSDSALPRPPVRSWWTVFWKINTTKSISSILNS